MIKGFALYLVLNSVAIFSFTLFGNYPIQTLGLLMSISGFLLFLGTGLFLMYKSDWIAERVLKASSDPVGFNLTFSYQWISLGLVLLGCMAAIRFLWGIQFAFGRLFLILSASDEEISSMGVQIFGFNDVLDLGIDLGCALFLLLYSKPLAKKLYVIHADTPEEELA
jgi:hypothetical protein